MAIQIKFDKSYNPIPPTLVLATRSGRKLGAIPATNIRFQDNMNAASEMSFSVYRDRGDNSAAIWDAITDLRLVWCKEWDAWFEIEVEISETDALMKTVSGTSLAEAELSQINLYEIEINTEEDVENYTKLHPDEDYSPTVLYDPEHPSQSLLHRLLQKAPHYSIGHVDTELADKQRTFSFDNKSIYDAFQEVAEELECLFVLDSSSNSTTGKPKRIVNVYAADNYGESTNIFVSTENLTDEVRLTTDVGEIKNCFKLQAGDDVMSAALRACNPNGSDYIWFFSDDMKTDMSHELASALDDYETDYDIINGIDFNSEHIVKASGGYSISSGCILTNGEKDLLLPDPQTDPPTVIDMDGYAGLVNTQYRAMERIDELTHTMSPGIDTTKPTIDHEKAAVDAAFANNSGFVAVSDVSRASEATVKSALKSRARAIVDSRFKVDVSSVSQPEEGATAWSGVVRISEYGDESIYRDSSVSFAVTDDLEKYIEQNIDIVLNKRESVKDAYDIPAIAKMPYSSDQEKAAFAEKVAMYSLKRLESLYDALRACMDIMIEQDVASGTWNEDIKSDLYNPYREKLGYTEYEIAIRHRDIANVEQVLEKLTKQIATINDVLDLENYLGSAAYLELSAYRRDDTYQNDNYISDGLTDAEIIENARQFYDAAIKECGKAAYGTHTISAKLANLLVIKEFEPIADAFEVGNYIRIEIDGRIFKLRMLQYEIDYENIGDLTVEFSDYNALRDGATELASILKNASSMSSSFSYVARQADKGKKANEQLTETTQIGLDLTKTRIVDNPDNQCITMDENGMLCRRKDPATGEYDPKQLKVLNNGIYTTDNNWNTVSAAFGDIFYIDPLTKDLVNDYGVIARALVGDKFICGDLVAYYGALISIQSDYETTTVDGKEVKYPVGYRITCFNGRNVPEEHKDVESFVSGVDAIKFITANIQVFTDIFETLEKMIPFFPDVDVQSHIKKIVNETRASIRAAFFFDFYTFTWPQNEYVGIRNGRVYMSSGVEDLGTSDMLAIAIGKSGSFDEYESSGELKVLAYDARDISGSTITGFGSAVIPAEPSTSQPVGGEMVDCAIYTNTAGNKVAGDISFENFAISNMAAGQAATIMTLDETERQYSNGSISVELSDSGLSLNGYLSTSGPNRVIKCDISNQGAGYSGSATLSMILNYQSSQ